MVLVFKYVLAWFPLVIIAIANGGLREMTFGRHIAELRAHQLSTVLGLLFFGLYIRAVTRWLGMESVGQAMLVGAIWLVLTVGFEFGFGRFVRHLPWSRLFHDYDLLAGRIWILVLIWVAVSPYLFYSLAG